MENHASEHRLAVLERRVRWGGALCLGFAAVALLSAATRQDRVAEELRARRIALVDAEGRVRAELGIDPDGSAGLFVRDVEGRPRAMVVHDEQQSALYLLDQEGTIRLGSAQFAHGGGGYALHGPGSKGGAVLYLKGDGSLTFYGEDGTVQERIPAE